MVAGKEAGMSELILVSVEERILRIQINRAEKKNALTQAMYASLAQALEEGEANPDVRAVLIMGSGGVFSAGNDISDFLTAFSMDESSPVLRFLHALAGAQKPIVAAVQGPAIGICTTLLLHCDLVFAGRGAKFQLPFVNLGLVPEAGSSLILPALLGQRGAAALLLLGDSFDAETAQRAGIVNTVVADGDVVETALAAARTLSAKPPAALRLTKQLMKRWSADGVREAVGHEAALFAQQLRSPEAAEALQAFMERRKPDFSRF